MDDERRKVAGWWRDFGVAQCRGYSPLYERICAAVAEDEAVLDLVLAAPFFGRQPNVLLAAAHDLVLRGVEHPLSELYAAASEGTVPDGRDPGVVFCDLVRSHPEEITATLATRRTNTNECGRSAVLAPALRWAADRIGEPLALLDAGTSAGLNLRLDRYHLAYDDGSRTGPADSPVHVTCALRGRTAPIADRAPAIAARIGLDRAPVDLDDPAEVRWMLACVWPDTGRLDRTRAAIELARRDPVEIVAGDVIDDLAATVARLPPSLPLAVTTSWVLAYVRPRDRPRFVDGLSAVSVDRPVAWISAEAVGVVPGLPEVAPPDPAPSDEGVELSVLGATLFRDGRLAEAVVLGRCHPHGSLLEWLARSA